MYSYVRSYLQDQVFKDQLVLSTSHQWKLYLNMTKVTIFSMSFTYSSSSCSGPQLSLKTTLKITAITYGRNAEGMSETLYNAI